MERKLTKRSFGNVSGLYGDATGLYGDIDLCGITHEERTKKIDIVNLIMD